jgi:ketosteroid isomerase-like protein
MSSANVELARSIFVPWERGDFSSAEWAHPEIELVIMDGTSPGRWTGRAAMAEAWRNVLDAWVELRAKAEEYRELDGDRVLVLLRNTGRGKTSGLELGQIHTKSANLFHIHDGKVTRLIMYFDWELALADLGLPPEAFPADS